MGCSAFTPFCNSGGFGGKAGFNWGDCNVESSYLCLISVGSGGGGPGGMKGRTWSCTDFLLCNCCSLSIERARVEFCKSRCASEVLGCEGTKALCGNSFSSVVLILVSGGTGLCGSGRKSDDKGRGGRNDVIPSDDIITPNTSLDLPE